MHIQTGDENRSEFVSGLVLTASPDFVAVLREEVRDLLCAEDALALLGDGVLFWRTASPAIARQLILDHPPVFLHHLHPAIVWQWSGKEELQQLICERLAADLASAPAGCRVALQGRVVNSRVAFEPRELKQVVDRQLFELGFLPEIKHPDWIISVTVAGEQVYYGVSKAADNLSNWTSGMVHFRKESGDISRSKFKLMEAIVRWELQFPAGGIALDLGAAPGGWTSVLLEHGLRVIAVDTAPLDARLIADPKLTCLQQNVRDLVLPAGTHLDVLTCDMSWDPFFTVRAVNQLVKYLTIGAQAVLTVKLMGKRPRQTVRDVMAALSPELQVVHAQHLFHNREEVTLHLMRR